MNISQSGQTLLGRGKVYFDRFTTAGVSTGLRFLGVASKLEITPKSETAQLYDYSVATAGLLSEATTKLEISMAMTLHEYTKENLALVLMGTDTGATQTTGSITAESLTTSVKKGRLYQTANRAISAVTVKQGATTLVSGTDYEIADATLGLIHILDASVTVTDGSAITIDYTKGAIATPGLGRVQIGTSSSIFGKLLFVGDPAAGPAMDAELWKISLSADAVLGFITGDSYGSFDLGGKLINDATNHPSEPYGRLTNRA